MADRIFRYEATGTKTQVLFSEQVRSSTEDVEIFIRDPERCRIQFEFLDVPGVANRVTPRFLFNGGQLLIPEVPVEGPDVRQVYLLGHGQVVPSGVVGNITGQTEGPGQGVMVDYDLEITAIDQMLARGITGHQLLTPTHFRVEMLHDGGADITYSATITVGDLGA